MDGNGTQARFSIREAEIDDLDAIRAQLPRLAAFDIPRRRRPEHLWQGDEKMLLAWARGEQDGCMVHVAVDPDGRLLGAIMLSLRPELLNGEPSAHLEVLTVDDAAEGIGVGRELVATAERLARSQGARTITLHVFATNSKARRLYERLGYDGELMRYIKDLD